jgi:spore maturation protein CgeB
MNTAGSTRSTTRILLAVMAQSPFNRSIWMGLARGFQASGCHVEVISAELLPEPRSRADRPDLLFAVHGRTVPADVLAAWRKEGIPTAVYLLDEPYEVDLTTTWARNFDWVFSVDRATVPVHAAFSRAVHLPLGYDATIFRPDGPRIESEILVLGSPFQTRDEFLRPLIDRMGERITWVGPGWRNVTSAGKHHEGLVSPEGCAAYYRGAQIVINIHRDSFWSHFGDLNKSRIEATHLNPRYWEAGACRAFQLTSWRPDLEAFAPESPSFRTPVELLNLVERFSADANARSVVSSAVLARLAKHDYRHRAQAILETVNDTNDD